MVIAWSLAMFSEVAITSRPADGAAWCARSSSCLSSTGRVGGSNSIGSEAARDSAEAPLPDAGEGIFSISGASLATALDRGALGLLGFLVLTRAIIQQCDLNFFKPSRGYKHL